MSAGEGTAVATAPSANPPLQAPERCDLAIVGGGIVGLAVARELSRRNPRASVCVLERESQVGTHQTGHNSGVIHAGVYYQPGSLKARLCVEGARELYEYCADRGIAHEKCGKVIIATDSTELARLEELERRGKANGVPGLRRIDAAAIEQIYLATLSRRPTVGELDIATRHISKLGDRAQGLQDVQYALFNLGEFLLRH